MLGARLAALGFAKKFNPLQLFQKGAVGAWYDPSSLWGASDHLPRRNLLTYTEDFSNAAWTKNSVVATATGFLEQAGISTHYMGHTSALGAVSAGQQITLKARIVGVGRGWALFGLTSGSDFTTARYLRHVNLTTGELGQAVSSGVSNTTVSATVSALGGVEVVLSCSFNAANGNAGCTFYSATADGTTGFNGDATKGLNIYNVMRCTSSTLDQSYQRVTDWTTELYAHAARKNVPWLRRNRFLNTATLSTQTVSSVTATPLTVSFTGTGTITFSTAYVGTLVGTGASDRVTATFTPAAGNLVCTVTGSVTLAQCEVGSAATDYQAVGASWEAQYAANAAAAGVALTMYTDSAGTTPVTGPDSVIGFLGDLAQGYALGSELVVNGDFSGGFVSWIYAPSSGTHSTISSGVANIISSDSSYNGISQNVLTVGKFYLVTFELVSITTLGSGLRVRIGSGTQSAAFTTVGAKSFAGVCSTDGHVIFDRMGGVTNITIDNVSVRELPGYHAIQSGATGLKPALRLCPNGCWYIQRDLTDDALVTTFPNLGTSCVSYINNGSTVSETTGVTLNGALTQNTPAADYGRIYLSAPSSKAAQIIKWLKAKAGL